MVLKAQEVFVSSGKKKGSVRREINVVSSMRVTIMQSRHRKPHHALSHNLQKHEVEVSREKRNARGRSQTGRNLRPPCKYFFERYLHRIAL